MQKKIATIINQEDNPTLLELDLDKGLFTASNLVPEYKYYFHPFIDDEVYPDIRAFEDNLIRNHIPLFISTNYRYDDPVLVKNYDCVATWQFDSGYISYLFKRKKN